MRHVSDIHVDVPALRAALDATRQARGLSWREVARQVGINASTMSRMAQGHYPDVNAFVRMLHWLGMPYDVFVVGDGGNPAKTTKGPELVAQLTPILTAREDLGPPDVQLVQDLVSAVVRRITNANWTVRRPQ